MNVETVTAEEDEMDGLEWTFDIDKVEEHSTAAEAFVNVAPNKKHKNDKVPMASLLVRTVHKHLNGRPLIILWDSGSSLMWINSHCLPKGCIPA